MLSVLKHVQQRQKRMDKSEAELLVCKTHKCQAGCSCWLSRTFFPSTPRPHLLQGEERTVQQLIPCLSHPRNWHICYLLRAPSWSLHTWHQMPWLLRLVCSRRWGRQAAGAVEEHGRWREADLGFPMQLWLGQTLWACPRRTRKTGIAR